MPLVITEKNISSIPIRFATDAYEVMALNFLFNIQASEGKQALETPTIKKSWVRVAARFRLGSRTNPICCRPVKP